jgi:Transposase, Mutator family
LGGQDKDLYQVEVSASLISDATAAIDAEVSAWRSRTIMPVWPIVFFDAIVVHVRGANGRVRVVSKSRILPWHLHLTQPCAAAAAAEILFPLSLLARIALARRVFFARPRSFGIR